ncbi:macrolide family glycosyltransferase [Amycolatopsis minnesotensis]|uniref:Glycosyltransferase n=1 Tax=Amycolatopsis minnesotensis TaxID=337894 RepID=A0ABP5EEH8_9PSEU
MSKHFAVISPPAHGHVNPTLPLVRELTNRGHRVTYPIAEEFRNAVTTAGADFLELTPWERPRPQGKVQFTPEMVGMMMELIARELERNLPTLLARFEDDRPDVVCYDMMMSAGPILAERLGVPAIQLVPSFASGEGFSLRDELFSDFDMDHPAITAALDHFREATEAWGVTRPVGGMLTPVIEDLNLVFVPREFQYAGETFDDRFAFIGPSLSGREDYGDWQPPEPGTRLLFVSLGTAINNNPDFFKTCVEAFGGTGWRVAMATGDQVDRDQLGTVPPNFEVRQYFPQPAVLKHATVFATHAGMNSTMESLYYEVPTVSAPQMGEQAANARRAEELGLGRRLPEELTPAALRDAVEAVADDPGIRANLADMARVLSKAGGASAGADAVEAMLADRARTTG